MAVTTPAYCSREDVQRATDIKDGTIADARIDRAVQSAARNIEGHLHRLFHPWDGVKWFDWVNFQYAWPWRLWLDQHDLLCITAFSAGGVSIGLDQCFLRPANPKPGFPFRWVELDRSSSATFGGNAATPQNNIMITGTWGFTGTADDAGTLAADVTDSAGTVTVTDGSLMGVGDLLILGYSRGTPAFPDDALGHAGTIAPYLGERVLVSDRSVSDTGLAQSGSGCSTASAADGQLQWTGTGTAPAPGEVILLDAEQMLVVAASAAVVSVQRAWNGTVLTSHSGAEIYAYRSLTVLRGQGGTTAASWPATTTAVYRHRVPSLIRDLGLAEASNRLLQEVAGYSRTVGAGEAAMPASGMALADLWDEAETAYGRKNRSRVI